MSPALEAFSPRSKIPKILFLMQDQTKYINSTTDAATITGNPPPKHPSFYMSNAVLSGLQIGGQRRKGVHGILNSEKC